MTNNNKQDNNSKSPSCPCCGINIGEVLDRYVSKDKIRAAIKHVEEDYKQIPEDDVKLQWLNFAKREALKELLGSE